MESDFSGLNTRVNPPLPQNLGPVPFIKYLLSHALQILDWIVHGFSQRLSDITNLLRGALEGIPGLPYSGH